jgi:hypothetical protein
LGVDAQPPAPVQVVPVAVRIPPRAHQHKEIRLRFAAKQIVAGILDLPALPPHEQIASLRERGDQCHLPHAAVLLRRQQHPRIPRMNWETRACAVQVR